MILRAIICIAAAAMSLATVTTTAPRPAGGPASDQALFA